MVWHAVRWRARKLAAANTLAVRRQQC
jgi:hypothetical protein